MDQAVLDALQRWPDVPAVYGWLSLDKRGRWRLHPDQGAAQAITNPQILAFMDRNYAADAAGRWFFQNGPQRVYVDLPGAPYILRLDDRARGLVSHNGLAVHTVRHWWLDDSGQLWAETDLGPGLLDDRDLQAVLDRLVLDDGRPLLEAPEALQSPRIVRGLGGLAPLAPAEAAGLPGRLGFVARPRPGGRC
ncbi:DUF2946 family protein [Bordetella hinzii]|uniref:DUF2946 family protein n=1 Tax=Bordetella hinzii TaxID=103855 RepID=UPI00045A8974|nr:DUF2946 family protein [Bordetella hinzii]KCB49352.1 PF11161 family protein [Bordetella hinzii 4161]KXA74531.1 hypothetical protein AXA74_03670 [Bordetella hinzii LMG 13501]MCJ9710100.1 DUF2946 family protein [Bordetella hinzii]QDJ31427.1 hypothetical protein CBR68_03420 [Bordetella hinzii]QDJ35876.1 hypothetical protein CBR67_03985 [Bordetella hinzii]